MGRPVRHSKGMWDDGGSLPFRGYSCSSFSLRSLRSFLTDIALATSVAAILVFGLPIASGASGLHDLKRFEQRNQIDHFVDGTF